MDHNMVMLLAALESQLNDTIDKLIKERDGCDIKDKGVYRYVCKKIEQALTKVHEAQEKINYSKVDLKLD